jgi:hypothetical protein
MTAIMHKIIRQPQLFNLLRLHGEEERIMFKHIMNGASVDEALKIYQHHFDAKRVQTIRQQMKLNYFK